MQTSIQNNGLPLSRNVDERLKIFYIIVRPDSIPITCAKCNHQFKLNLRLLNGEAVRGIVSYRPEDALAIVKGKEGKIGYSIIWTGDFSYVDEIVNRVSPKPVEPMIIKQPVEEPQTKEQFLWNILMVSDNMVAGALTDKEKVEFKRIVKKIHNELKKEGDQASSPGDETNKEVS